MTSIAGLAALNHPLVEIEPSIAISEHFAVVLEAGSHRFTGHGPNQHDLPALRYALAARWCAQGAFVPLSWREQFGIEMFYALDATVAQSISIAIDACYGCIELAFELRFVNNESQAGPSQPASPATSGRAYLRALRGSHDARQGFLSRLRVCAAEGVFSVSMIATGKPGISGLLRCGAVHVNETKASLEGIVAPLEIAGLVITGPLPPFGAGAEIAALAGFAK